MRSKRRVDRTNEALESIIHSLAMLTSMETDSGLESRGWLLQSSIKHYHDQRTIIGLTTTWHVGYTPRQRVPGW